MREPPPWFSQAYHKLGQTQNLAHRSALVDAFALLSKPHRRRELSPLQNIYAKIIRTDTGHGLRQLVVRIFPRLGDNNPNFHPG